MPVIPPDVLLEEAKCYTCLGMSDIAAMILALEDRIAEGGTVVGAESFTVNSQFGAGFGGVIVSSSGFFAYTNDAAVTTIYPSGGFLNATATTFATIHPCASAVDATNAGHITFIDMQGTGITGTLNLTSLTSLASVNIDINDVSALLVGGLPLLVNVGASSNSMSGLAVGAVLIALDASGALNGTVNLQSNAVPHAGGINAAGNLEAKGWTVTTDEGAQMVTLTPDVPPAAVGAIVSTSTGFFAMRDAANVTTIFPDGGGSTGATTSAVIFPCFSATNDFNAGSITTIDCAGLSIGGTVDVTALPQLTSLFCPSNFITSITLDGLPNLIDVGANNNELTSAAVDTILIDLDNTGSVNGNVSLSGQNPPAPPGPAGLAAAANLIINGWTVLHD